MSGLLGYLVSRYWRAVLAAWIVLAIALGFAAPPWAQVTHDGDLAYLPSSLPSVEGELLLSKAFPSQRAKSQIAVIAEQPAGKLSSAELEWFDSLAARLEKLAGEIPLADVWTRSSEIVGDKLTSPVGPNGQAAAIVLQLTSEFMATDNVRVLERVNQVIGETRRSASFPRGLKVGISGSAAIGGDMLSSAAESIRNTEVATVVLVVGILLLVYRAPLLVLITLVTIGVSLSIATNLLALLASLGGRPGFEWFGFKIFTTTKIFIVVILYGAGTDFCLFLISRFKEELARGLDRVAAVRAAVSNVSGALVGSALTTVCGLGMMFFADFGKFRSSGPALGLCLLVTLLACLTLAPALVCACGRAVFWPFGTERAARGRAAASAPTPGLTAAFWNWAAGVTMAYPGRILLASVLALCPLAYAGSSVEVTYDFVSELDTSRASVQGTRMTRRHFPAGQTAPITILALKDGAQFDAPAGQKAIARLTKLLFHIEGVDNVRSITEPLGNRPGYFQPLRAGGLKKLAIRKHKLTEERFLSSVPEFKGDVTRFDVVSRYDPFSSEAIDLLDRIDERLAALTGKASSTWHGARFTLCGTTAGIRDLKSVTTSDQALIQQLVILAVMGVLVVTIRRPVVCLYLVVSVLFSYYVTIGTTELAFSWLYGASYHGLDWKVPVFLFVILIAVGEDYNIYLMSRVLEEQKRLGPLGGIRAAVARTGGIITSCGIIMAGTFVSMMTGTLRAMSELGFALSLGIMLDTCVVRPVLVPAFLALMERAAARLRGPVPTSVPKPMGRSCRDRMVAH